MYNFDFPSRSTTTGCVGYRGQNFAVRADDPNNLDSNSGNATIDNLLTVNCVVSDANTAINNAIYTKGGIASDLDLYTGGKHHVIGALQADSTATFADVATFLKNIKGTSASFSNTDSNTINIPQGGVTSNTATVISNFSSQGATALSGATTATNKVTIQYTPTAVSGVTPYAFENFGFSHLVGDVTADGNINVAKTITSNTLTTTAGATIGATLVAGGQRLTVDTVGSKIDLNATGQVGTGVTLDANNLTSNQCVNITNTAMPAIDPLTGNYTPSALNVLGGATITKKARFLSNVEILGGISGSQLMLNIGQMATDANTAALVIPNGGISAYNALYQGTLVAGTGLASTASSYDTAQTAVIRAPTMSTSGNHWVGGNSYVAGTLDLTGNATLLGTASIKGAANLQSTLQAAGAMTSTSTLNPSIDRVTSTQAALLLSNGGANIKGNVVAGGALAAVGLYLDADVTKNAAQINLTSEADVTKAGIIGMANNMLRIQAPTTAPVRFISNLGIGASLTGATGTNDDSYFRAGINGFFFKSTSASAASTYTPTNNATSVTDITQMTSRFQTSFGVDSAALFAGPMHLSRLSNGSAVSDASFAVEGVSIFNDFVQMNKALTVTTGDVSLTAGSLRAGGTGNFQGSVTTNGAVTASGSGIFGGSVSATTVNVTSTLIASPTAASLSTAGGLLVGANTITNGDVQVGGNLDVKGTSLLEGNVHIASTTATTSSSNQALVVDGRAAFNLGVMVTGPTVLQGDTTINGILRTTGAIEQSNVKDLFVQDNIPSFNVDSKLTTSGFALNRYQEANDNGTGNVIATSDLNDIVLSATVSVASATNGYQFVLDNTTATAALAKLGTFLGWCRFVSGTGAGQVRYVTAYNSSTQIVTIASSADQANYAVSRGGTANLTIGKDLTTPPDGTTVVAFYATGVAALLHLDSTASNGPEYHLGYTSRDPLSSVLSPDVNQYGLLKLKNLVALQNIKSDAILPYTPNGPVLLNNAISIYNNGNIGGITSINGATSSVTTTIVLPENAYLTNGAITLPLPTGVTDPTSLFGILKYYIKGMDMNGSICSGEKGCTANNNVKQQSTALIVAAGTLGEQVDVIWNYGSSPVLTHTVARATNNLTGNPISYKITYVYV